MDRATIRQKKTGRPVRFEFTDQTRLPIDEHLRLTGRTPRQFLFAGRGNSSSGLTIRQYARLVENWAASVGFDPAKFGTHSPRRTKAVLIYRRTGNLRAVQILLGHSEIESTVRYLGIELDDAIEIAEVRLPVQEQTDASTVLWQLQQMESRPEFAKITAGHEAPELQSCQIDP
jgi:integrase